MRYWFHREVLGHGLVTEATDHSIFRYCTCGVVWSRFQR